MRNLVLTANEMCYGSPIGPLLADGQIIWMILVFEVNWAGIVFHALEIDLRAILFKLIWSF